MYFREMYEEFKNRVKNLFLNTLIAQFGETVIKETFSYISVILRKFKSDFKFLIKDFKSNTLALFEYYFKVNVKYVSDFGPITLVSHFMDTISNRYLAPWAASFYFLFKGLSVTLHMLFSPARKSAYDNSGSMFSISFLKFMEPIHYTIYEVIPLVIFLPVYCIFRILTSIIQVVMYVWYYVFLFTVFPLYAVLYFFFALIREFFYTINLFNKDSERVMHEWLQTNTIYLLNYVFAFLIVNTFYRPLVYFKETVEFTTTKYVVKIFVSTARKDLRDPMDKFYDTFYNYMLETANSYVKSHRLTSVALENLVNTRCRIIDEYKVSDMVGVSFKDYFDNYFPAIGPLYPYTSGPRPLDSRVDIEMDLDPKNFKESHRISRKPYQSPTYYNVETVSDLLLIVFGYIGLTVKNLYNFVKFFVCYLLDFLASTKMVWYCIIAMFFAIANVYFINPQYFDDRFYVLLYRIEFFIEILKSIYSEITGLFAAAPPRDGGYADEIKRGYYGHVWFEKYYPENGPSYRGPLQSLWNYKASDLPSFINGSGIFNLVVCYYLLLILSSTILLLTYVLDIFSFLNDILLFLPRSYSVFSEHCFYFTSIFGIGDIISNNYYAFISFIGKPLSMFWISGYIFYYFFIKFTDFKVYRFDYRNFHYATLPRLYMSTKLFLESLFVKMNSSDNFYLKKVLSNKDLVFIFTKLSNLYFYVSNVNPKSEIIKFFNTADFRWYTVERLLFITKDFFNRLLFFVQGLPAKFKIFFGVSIKDFLIEIFFYTPFIRPVSFLVYLLKKVKSMELPKFSITSSTNYYKTFKVYFITTLFYFYSYAVSLVKYLYDFVNYFVKIFYTQKSKVSNTNKLYIDKIDGYKSDTFFPHLSVYNLEPGALMSITFRVSAIIMSLLFFLYISIDFVLDFDFFHTVSDVDSFVSNFFHFLSNAFIYVVSTFNNIIFTLLSGLLGFYTNYFLLILTYFYHTVYEIYALPFFFSYQITSFLTTLTEVFYLLPLKMSTFVNYILDMFYNFSSVFIRTFDFIKTQFPIIFYDTGFAKTSFFSIIFTIVHILFTLVCGILIIVTFPFEFFYHLAIDSVSAGLNIIVFYFANVFPQVLLNFLNICSFLASKFGVVSFILFTVLVFSLVPFYVSLFAPISFYIFLTAVIVLAVINFTDILLSPVYVTHFFLAHLSDYLESLLVYYSNLYSPIIDLSFNIWGSEIVNFFNSKELFYFSYVPNLFFGGYDVNFSEFFITIIFTVFLCIFLKHILHSITHVFMDNAVTMDYIRKSSFTWFMLEFKIYLYILIFTIVIGPLFPYELWYGFTQLIQSFFNIGFPENVFSLPELLYNIFILNPETLIFIKLYIHNSIETFYYFLFGMYTSSYEYLSAIIILFFSGYIIHQFFPNFVNVHVFNICIAISSYFIDKLLSFKNFVISSYPIYVDIYKNFYFETIKYLSTFIPTLLDYLSFFNYFFTIEFSENSIFHPLVDKFWNTMYIDMRPFFEDPYGDDDSWENPYYYGG